MVSPSLPEKSDLRMFIKYFILVLTLCASMSSRALPIHPAIAKYRWNPFLLGLDREMCKISGAKERNILWPGNGMKTYNSFQLAHIRMLSPDDMRLSPRNTSGYKENLASRLIDRMKVQYHAHYPIFVVTADSFARDASGRLPSTTKAARFFLRKDKSPLYQICCKNRSTILFLKTGNEEGDAFIEEVFEKIPYCAAPMIASAHGTRAEIENKILDIVMKRETEIKEYKPTPRSL